MKFHKIDELITDQQFWLKQATQNKIFVYPTDTLYGIGAIVNSYTVNKIYEIKQRPVKKLFSIIAPDVDWIYQHFIVPDRFEDIFNDYLKKHHGITLILQKKDPKFLGELNPGNKIGIRLINHPLQMFVEKLGEPFITTSANISGNPSPKSVKQIDKKIIDKVDFVIDGGETFGKPSTIIDFSTGEIIR